MLLTLYKKSCKAHILEYGSSVWSVIYKKEAIQIEKCTKKSNQKLIPELRDLSYSNRLRTLGLPTLQYRETESRYNRNIQDIKRHRYSGQR